MCLFNLLHYVPVLNNPTLVLVKSGHSVGKVEGGSVRHLQQHLPSTLLLSIIKDNLPPPGVECV